MAETYHARLPRIAAGSSSFSLPLSESAAWALIGVLLASDQADRHAGMLKAVCGDAPLALWAICRANATHDRPLRTLDDVTQWLTRSGIGHDLQWPDQQLRSRPATDHPTLTRWEELAAGSAQVVQQVQHQGASPEDAASLLALVHNAEQWLLASIEATDPSGGDRSDVTLCLPPWLTDVLCQRDQDSPLVSPGSQVARALSGGDQHQAAEPTGARGPASMGPDRWRPGPSRLMDTLPALVRRLLRCEELEKDFAGQLEHEKLLAMKELAYGAGHEINNPLANISSRAQTLLRQETDPDNRRKLATINAQAFRAHEMIADMMLFASPPPLELRPVRVAPLIDEVIDQLKPVAQAQGTRIEQNLVETLPEIEADPVQVQVALQSICANSLEALGYGGQVQIDALAETTDGVHGVAVRIRDTGPGIPPDVRRHLFDPFYSGREAGRGLGFGLSKAWTIVAAHGGRIEVESDAGVGATFLVRLPVQLPCDVTRQGAG